MASGDFFSFALVDTDTTVNHTNTPSFSNLTAGTPQADRFLIAVITCTDNDIAASPGFPATCTIGGVTANRVVTSGVLGSGVMAGVALYSAIVPTGATVTVSLTSTFSGLMDDWALALFRATGAVTTPIDTDTGLSADIDTRRTRFVVIGYSNLVESVSNPTGGGNITTAVVHNFMLIAYDDDPLGGSNDAYDSDPGSNTIHALASYRSVSDRG